MKHLKLGQRLFISLTLIALVATQFFVPAALAQEVILEEEVVTEVTPTVEVTPESTPEPTQPIVEAVVPAPVKEIEVIEETLAVNNSQDNNGRQLSGYAGLVSPTLLELAAEPSVGITAAVKYSLEGKKANAALVADDASWTSGNLCQGVGGCYAENTEIPLRTVIANLVPGNYVIELQHEYMDEDGVLGYLNFNDDGSTLPLPDQNVTNVVITLVTDLTSNPNGDACGPKYTCLNYTLSFTYNGVNTGTDKKPEYADAQIYFEALVSGEASNWHDNGNKGGSLHMRMTDPNGGGDLAVQIEPGTEIEPEPIDVVFTISKYNSAADGGILAGESVTYTIVVTAPEYNGHPVITNLNPSAGGIISIYDVNVSDVTPAGFTFVPGTSTVTSNINGTIAVSEPIYSTKGVWELGNMESEEEITITYVAKSASSINDGEYPDLAWANGYDGSYSAASVGISSHTQSHITASSADNAVNDVFVGTSVTIMSLAQNGVVLGSSTGLPNTGIETTVSIMAFALMIMGAVAMLYTRLSKKLNLNLSKALRTFALASFAIVAFAFVGATGVSAANTLVVRLEEAESPTSSNTFDLSYVALDAEGGSVDVICYMQGPSDVSYVAFEGPESLGTGGGNGECKINSSILSANGTYKFKVQAIAGTVDTFSNEITVAYDGTFAGTPVNYSKTKASTCSYTIKAITANDGGETTKVEVYRATTSSFIANSSTLVATISTGSNQSISHTNTVPDCNGTYFYAIRAVDASGNGSSFVGDSATQVTIQNPNNRANGGANIAGIDDTTDSDSDGVDADLTSNNGEGDNGNILGTDDNADNSADSENTVKGPNWLLIVPAIVIGLFVVGGTGFYVITKRSNK